MGNPEKNTGLRKEPLGHKLRTIIVLTLFAMGVMACGSENKSVPPLPLFRLQLPLQCPYNNQKRFHLLLI